MALKPDGPFRQRLGLECDVLDGGPSRFSETVIGPGDQERKRGSRAETPVQMAKRHSAGFDLSKQEYRHRRHHGENGATIDGPIQKAEEKGSKNPKKKEQGFRILAPL